jgi:MFS family permease
MFRDALPARPEARRFLIGTVFSALGRGFTLPFLFVYLTKVLDIPESTAGLLIGWFGLLTLVASPIGGTLIDRFGARKVVLPGLLVEAIAMGGLALAHNASQVWLVLTLGGLAGSTIWAGQATILTSITAEHERQKVFGLQFALLNLGIGVGATVSGSIVDVDRPGTFQLVYFLDMLCYLAPVLVLLSMPRVGLRLVEPKPHEGKKAGYAVVFRDRRFRRFMIFSLLLTISGYAQLEVGFAGFALDVIKVDESVIGYAFAANTVVIVIAQLFVIKFLQGRSRTRTLSMVGVVFALAWLILGLSGLVNGRNVLVSTLGVVTFMAVFAFGETLLSPTQPTVVNALATDEVRGRYNALSGMTWGISAVVAPVSAGPLLEHGLGGVWIGLVIGGCLIASLIAFSLRKLIGPEADGTATSSEPIDPAGSAVINPASGEAGTTLDSHESAGVRVGQPVT